MGFMSISSEHDIILLIRIYKYLQVLLAKSSRSSSFFGYWSSCSVWNDEPNISMLLGVLALEQKQQTKGYSTGLEQ